MKLIMIDGRLHEKINRNKKISVFDKDKYLGIQKKVCQSNMYVYFKLLF